MMKLLTKEQQEPNENVKKLLHLRRKKFENKYVKDIKNIAKLEVIAIIQGYIELLCIAHVI